MKWIFTLCFLGLIHILKAQDNEQFTRFETFEALQNAEFVSSNEKVKVINFWATWCKPCIDELPVLEALHQADNNIEVVLVSLDFPRQVETKLKPFLLRENLQSKVVLLEDGKAQEWIDKVDPSWSGAIPASLFLKGDQRVFHEGKFNSEEEVMELIKDLIRSEK